MLYVDASVLRLQGMKTPQEMTPQQLLDKAIRDHPELNHTELGRRLGYKHPYQAINKLVTGKKQFTPDLQERIADLLGLPKTHFADPALTEERSRFISKRLEEFRATDIGRRQSIDDMRLIERIGRAFVGDRLPSLAFFEVIALTLQGRYTFDQLSTALAENDRRELLRVEIKSDVEQRALAVSNHPNTNMPQR